MYATSAERWTAEADMYETMPATSPSESAGEAGFRLSIIAKQVTDDCAFTKPSINLDTKSSSVANGPMDIYPYSSG